MTIHELLRNHGNLTPNDVLIFQLIAERIQIKGNLSLYYVRDLCKVSGISDKTVRRAIQKLDEEGLLIVDRTSKGNRYSLSMDSEPPRPPKRRTKREESVPVSSTVSESPNNISKNIIPFGLSDKSDIAHPDIVVYEDPQAGPQEPNLFDAPELADLPQDAVAVVRREYERLRTWYGRQPIRIGGVPRRPADVRRRMRELTAENVAQVVRAYADGWIRSAVCGVQTALFNAPQFRRYASPTAAAVGQTQPAEPPAATPAPARSPQRKPRNAFCAFEQRTYDYDALERQFEQLLMEAPPRGDG